MKNSNIILKTLLWTARITGTLILAFILFMILAHIFGQGESGSGLNDTLDIVSFIFFPISSVVGLSLALKWEGVGGLITILGMIGLIIVRPDLLIAFLVLVPIIPGILYTTYWAYAIEINRHESVA